jgi:nucleotide-binding universal stress UspA family protein
VPLDGSQFAEQALPLALSIANRAGASLEVVQVHVLYAFQEPACSWLPFDPTEDAIFKEYEQAYLDAIVRRLQKTALVPVTSFLASGMIVDGILDRVRTKPADLIVMTTHGRGPMSRFWLGSVAVELVRHGPAPILLVRPQEDSTAPPSELTLKRILIPLDGSDLAEGVLEPAVALGSSMDAEYVLIRAVETNTLGKRCRQDRARHINARTGLPADHEWIAGTDNPACRPIKSTLFWESRNRPLSRNVAILASLRRSHRADASQAVKPR